MLIRALLIFVIAGCQTDPCPPYGLIERARAQDQTHVELAMACEIAAPALDQVTVGAYTRPDIGLLSVKALSRSGKTLVVTTTPQTGLVTYTLKLEDVVGGDGKPRTASANFVGLGAIETAPVTFTVDDRYAETLTSAAALVTFDPTTGVFTHYSSVLPLEDPDGDHVFSATVEVAVDPLRTVSETDDRLGSDRQAYAVRAVTADGTSLSDLITFEVTSPSSLDIALPLLSVPAPPGPEGLVPVHVTVVDTAARALTLPTLRASIDENGYFDASFPTTASLIDDDEDGNWETELAIQIDPDRHVGGTTSNTFPYVFFVANEGVDYPGVATEVAATTEATVDATIVVGNPSLVPVTFRVDVSAAYLDRSGSLRGVGYGGAVFLTGELGTAEDAFGQNAADAFSGGENVVLEMVERTDYPGVWERTLFLGPSRPYGWKAVRCPAGIGCADLNRHVTSTGRAFATVMKNLVTENLDAASYASVRIVDPRDPLVTMETGELVDYGDAEIYGGLGIGTETDPEGTPNGEQLFKQELPDLVVEVGTTPVTTPVVVVGTWRDVNLPTSLADIVLIDGTFDLNPWDYDSGFIGGSPPTYELPSPEESPPFVIGDGAVDPDAALVPGGTAATMTLHAALFGTTLYLATEDAGEGADHFLFVAASASSGVAAAPWSKLGTVALPPDCLFLADENDSTFVGWFRLDGTLLEDASLTGAASGGVLEGTVDLSAWFSVLPETIYVAVAPYASADGGALYWAGQMPASVDADGDLDATEVASITLATIEISP